MISAFVVPNGTQWQIKVNSRVLSSHNTQEAAMDAARTYLHNNGGGELVVLGVNGQIRVKDTIAPARDPRSSRG